MTDERLNELRRLTRDGRLEPDLVEELKGVVARLVRLRLLPPSYAPYGQWDDEAVDDVFADWYEQRLLGRGHLQLLLDRARTVSALRRLAEHSLRQHLLNQRARSQAQNLYWRVVELLDADDEFELVRDAARPQDRWWRLKRSDVAEWGGDDRLLVAHAWALGDFTLVRYRADAKKLSPLLDAGELKRFVVGLLERASAALTPTLIMRTLGQRFDLGAVAAEELTEATTASGDLPDVASEVALADAARAVIAELTPRQVEVLRRSDEQTDKEMAQALGCSVGTIYNEQRRIAAVISRVSEEDEREALLKIVSDLLY
jgi:DNA-binding CsgD family transcriptional regulator